MQKLSSVIVLVCISCLPATHAVADWINVKNWNPAWNAVGDGINNDSPAIQQAINSAPTGSTLYFPAGTYKLLSTVATGYHYWENYALFVNKSLTLRGDGSSSVLLQSNCTTTLIFADYSSLVAGLSIENISFQGDTNDPSTVLGTNGFYSSGPFIACYGLLSSGARAKGLKLRNIRVEDQGARNAFEIAGMDDVLIEGCSFIHFANTGGSLTGLGKPSIGISPEGTGSLRLLNNHFDGGTPASSTTAPYGADGMIYQQGGDEVTIIGNTLRNFKLEGLQIAAKRITVTGNTFLGPATQDSTVAVTLTPNSAWVGPNVQIAISGNICEQANNFFSTIPLSTDAAVSIDATVTGNVINLGQKQAGLPGSSAIDLARGRRVVISGNTIDNYWNTAAYLSGTTSNDSSLVFTGNSLTSMSTNPATQIAVWVNWANGTGTPFNCWFRNMTFENNTLSGGAAGSLWVYGQPTGSPGRVIIGNNIYIGPDNSTPLKGVAFQNSASQVLMIHPGTTNWANYKITDIGPDY